MSEETTVWSETLEDLRSVRTRPDPTEIFRGVPFGVLGYSLGDRCPPLLVASMSEVAKGGTRHKNLRKIQSPEKEESKQCLSRISVEGIHTLIISFVRTVGRGGGSGLFLENERTE